MANIDQNYDGSTKLRDWYPKVKSNFSAINTQVEEHVGNSDNPHAVTKAQVGLSNVDNTSDANKPVSTATQAALNDKADQADLTAHTGNKNNPHAVTKAQVGLANVDNTSDANKPVSAATQAALDNKADKQNADGGAAFGDGAETNNGGAVGQNAVSTTGGAVGAYARSTTGGAVGFGAYASSGFAGGDGAETYDPDTGEDVDAIQLGAGTNRTAKTLQVYSYQLLDANGKIPDARLNDCLLYTSIRLHRQRKWRVLAGYQTLQTEKVHLKTQGTHLDTHRIQAKYQQWMRLFGGKMLCKLMLMTLTL